MKLSNEREKRSKNRANKQKKKKKKKKRKKKELDLNSSESMIHCCPVSTSVQLHEITKKCENKNFTQKERSYRKRYHYNRLQLQLFRTSYTNSDNLTLVIDNKEYNFSMISMRSQLNRIKDTKNRWKSIHELNLRSWIIFDVINFEIIVYSMHFK